MTKVNKNDLVSIPVIGTIKAGVDGIAFEEELGTEFATVNDLDTTFEYFWLKVQGDSMVGDGIFENDYALIKKTIEFNNNDICAVIVDGEEGTLKHVTKTKDSIILTASNPEYSPRFFTGKEMNKILIAGKLIQTKRKY
ncbi:LexA family protein [Pediococcus acidilactici]